MDKLYRLGEAAKILGVSVSTLRRWDREGRIRFVRTPGGQRRVPESEIKRLLNLREEQPRYGARVIIYARVSSYKQKDQGDLDRQVNYLRAYARERGWIVVDVIRDVASGLKTDRRGLRKLFGAVLDGKCDIVLITYRDRLTRFGFEYIEYFFNRFGVRIEVAMDEDKSPMEELVEDFIEIVTSFAARIYGKRSHKAKKLLEAVMDELEGD